MTVYTYKNNTKGDDISYKQSKYLQTLRMVGSCTGPVAVLVRAGYTTHRRCYEYTNRTLEANSQRNDSFTMYLTRFLHYTNTLLHFDCS